MVGSRVCSLVMMYLEERERETEFMQQMFQTTTLASLGREDTPPLIYISCG